MMGRRRHARAKKRCRLYMSLFLGMNTKFLKLLIICSRTISVFIGKSSAYISTPSLLATLPHFICSGDGTVLCCPPYESGRQGSLKCMAVSAEKLACLCNYAGNLIDGVYAAATTVCRVKFMCLMQENLFQKAVT